MADTVGMKNIRGEAISAVVTGFALREYKFKQLCMINSSSKESQTYYQETAADLTGGTGAAVQGVPRLAGFPHAEVSWTKQTGYLIKHGAESVISWEDILSDNVDVLSRTTMRIARSVTKSVDTNIWTTISEGPTATPTNINYVTIAAGHEWDSATLANQDPIKDILNAKRQIAEDDYDPNNNGYLLLSPKDFQNLMANASVRNATTFFTPDVTSNGRIGRICGLTIIVSNNVSADFALVCIAKECATWVEAAPLTTATITEEGVSKTIRSWEYGVCQLKNPNAVCLIVNTQA